MKAYLEPKPIWHQTSRKTISCRYDYFFHVRSLYKNKILFATLSHYSMDQTRAAITAATAARAREGRRVAGLAFSPLAGSEATVALVVAVAGAVVVVVVVAGAAVVVVVVVVAGVVVVVLVVVAGGGVLVVVPVAVPMVVIAERMMRRTGRSCITVKDRVVSL